ncbi:MAG: PspC domain-containing protein [Chitinophagaceae bacterium]
MKKVININFQGRVVPIEESAYEMLQQYTGSLRSYFANEEGRDEIINDIESRIGELFAEQLKKGAPCITDADVNAIMNSMGRPSDFEEADDEGTNPRNQDTRSKDQATNEGQSNSQEEQAGSTKKRLYRDEEDKILGGVASGLSNYLGIDPAVMRILFAVSAFAGGFGFLVYIILWIALPSRSLVTSIRKRLYRDSDDKIFGGVCGGLAKYFDINVSIPRVIFAAPFIFGLITSIGRNFFLNGPVIIGGFSGGTFILTYIILWIVLPEAVTAHEKLEMKGEKIDLNSIRNTVMEDMKGFKERAEKMGKEFTGSAKDMGEKARQMGEEARRVGKEFGKAGKQAGEAFKTGASTIMGDTSSAVRRNRGGLGNAILILVKAFVFFVIGCVALALFAGLIVLLSGGVGVLPLKDFFLEGVWQNVYAWGTLLLFAGIPIIAFITWLIRRMMKVKTHNRYIGYSFSALWFVGLFCLIALIATLSRSFSTPNSATEDITVVQPANNNLLVMVAPDNRHGYSNWLNFDGVISIEGDSLYMNTVRVNIIKSPDSLYHLHAVKISNGSDNQNSRELVEKISFPITQRDSVIYLPESFGISKHDKWRNQRVLVVLEVPVGKKVKMDESLYDYDYFNVEFGNRRNRRINLPRNWQDGENWHSNRTMIMTNEDLVPFTRKGRDNKEYRYDEQEPKQNNDDNDDNGNLQPAPAKSQPATPEKIKKDSIIKVLKDSLMKLETGYRYEGNGKQVASEETVGEHPATDNDNQTPGNFSPLSSFPLID